MTDDPIDELPDCLPAPREPTRLVGVDDRGNRVGEDHPRAKLSDDEVELIRQLYEEGQADPTKWLSMRAIAEKFECSIGNVCMIVNFNRRASYPVGWRRVRLVVRGHERDGTSTRVAKTDPKGFVR
jgi:hypothetical protein